MSYNAKISKGKKFTDEKPVMVLHDVYFYYMKHAEGGAPKYKTNGETLLDCEYSLQVLVTKAIAKQIKKFHKKLSLKECTAEEFEAQFKVAPPFVSEDDEYYTISLSNNAGYKDKKTGEIKPLSAFTVVNSFRESLADTLVGNGSKGMMGINITEYDHPKYGKGTSINIGMVKITELVEYIAPDSSADDDDDFDFEENPDLDSDDDGFDEDPDAMAEEESKEALKEQQEAAQDADEDDTDEDIF